MTVDAYAFLKGQWLSQKEAAEVLRISQDTVRRRCDDGTLRRAYDGRKPRICAFSIQMVMNTYTDTPDQGQR